MVKKLKLRIRAETNRYEPWAREVSDALIENCDALDIRLGFMPVRDSPYTLRVYAPKGKTPSSATYRGKAEIMKFLDYLKAERKKVA